MKTVRIALFTLFTISGLLLVAQPKPPCHYDEKMELGGSLYGKGQYKQAKKAFEDAGCPSNTPLEKTQRHKWIQKCVDALKEQQKKMNTTTTVKSTVTTTTPVANKPVLKPEAKVSSVSYMEAMCSNSMRGAKQSVIVTAKNLENQKITVRLAITSSDGGEKPLASHKLSREYTLADGRFGMEQEFEVSEQEDYITAEYFLPFCVMDFNKNEIIQDFVIDVSVIQSDNGQLLARYNEEQVIRTHSLTFKGRTGDIELVAESDGGAIRLSEFAGCGIRSFRDIEVAGLPYWMNMEEKIIRLVANPSKKERSATLYATPAIGGNTVKIIVTQKGN
jgi:hypothetical protein